MQKVLLLAGLSAVIALPLLMISSSGEGAPVAPATLGDDGPQARLASDAGAGSADRLLGQENFTSRRTVSLDVPDQSDSTSSAPDGLHDDQLDEIWSWDQVDRKLESLLRIQNPERLTADLVDWPDSPTLEWLRKKFGSTIEAKDLERVLDVAEVQNRHVRNAASEYVLHCDAAISSVLQTQSYDRYNVATGEVVPPLGMGESNHQFPGWVVRFKVDAEQYPEVALAQSRFAEARNERKRAILNAAQSQ